MTHQIPPQLRACALLVSGAAMVSASATGAEPALRNSIDMAFVTIPAGSFLMGASSADREAGASNMPQHTVRISKPFMLGRFEVTQAQWLAVMASPSNASARSNPYHSLPGMAARLDKPDHPATVSWHEAQAFVRSLNAKEGHTRCRLPTEAEWEYAARAGTTTAYSFGDDARQLSRHAWFGEDFASGSTHPVGQKLANAWGLHDMHGNVWEWVQDWFDPGGDRLSPGVDPFGPESGTAKVVRGGSWHVTSGSWHTAVRKPYAPDYRGISIGLRVACDLPASGP